MLGMLRDGHGLRAQQEPAPAPASTAAAAPDPASRTIRLEAIATDKLGAPITNLRAEDFSVLVDGVAQKLDGVEARSNAPPAVGPIAPPDEIKDDGDEARAAREPGTRVVGIYLDEYHVSAGEHTERVRNAVSRFIDDELRPSDLAGGDAAARPPDGASALPAIARPRGPPSAASPGGATTTRRARRSRISILADRQVRCARRVRRS